MKRGKHTGEKSHRVFPVKTPNSTARWKQGVHEACYVSVFTNFLSRSWHWISSFSVLLLLPEPCRKKQISLTPTALVLAQSRKLPRPTGTPTPTSLWTANSPQLHPHSPTNPSAACTGCCPIPTRPFGKKWDITEHIPIAQSTSTAGEEELGATSYAATAGMCHVVHLSATCQWLFTGWFKQTF